ncbi:uncharacterized protein CIMG_13360 [Coccidioides immitis RS]|uniref:Uncharacterized protein n=2 Tax=Coccidioides TaxID=5500 RepID=A0A0E1S3A5_COCIM|nr:uncharacterized protein CIMG_13360 [Coccidioides immitis RS]EAS33408.1 hypothetical protein CIMG_13360 [Coccidioides immitis RS]EFW16998.1 conserved hypothetical protein [Coccidioides posadasii str. Silveira]QVM09122.1 hypothetical protein D8B26_003788 [Coccidioides posadasii str. Silveira]
MFAGRQSPSPSRQTGRQQSDLPGWTGQAESHNGHASLFNPSAHTANAKPTKEEMEDQSRRKDSASSETDGGVEHLESNPVHPLAEIAKGKIH